MLRLARVTAATLDVLRVLSEAESATWGLQVVSVTGRPAGSVYPILARLEEGGWVTSRWSDDPVRGPRRRLYELSEDGRRSAEALLTEVAQQVEGARTPRPRLEGGLA